MAISAAFSSFATWGSLARFPASEGASLPKATESSGSSAMVFIATVRTRLNSFEGVSFSFATLHHSGNGDVGGGFRQLLAEAALVELGHHTALQLVALVEEGEAEGKAHVAEDLGILRPGDDGARAHDG